MAGHVSSARKRQLFAKDVTQTLIDAQKKLVNALPYWPKERGGSLVRDHFCLTLVTKNQLARAQGSDAHPLDRDGKRWRNAPRFPPPPSLDEDEDIVDLRFV